MGRLIKNHWARLIVLSAATCQFKLNLPWDGARMCSYLRGKEANPLE